MLHKNPRKKNKTKFLEKKSFKDKILRKKVRRKIFLRLKSFPNKKKTKKIFF